VLRTVTVKLGGSDELVQTIRTFNRACQVVLDFGFEGGDYNKARLNGGTYSKVRELYPMLPSALVQTSRDQASDMLKRSRKSAKQDKDCKDYFKYRPVKRELSAIRFDHRTMKVFLESGKCSLSTLFGRLHYSFVLGDYYQQYIGWGVKNAQLVLRDNICYLHVQVECETPELSHDDSRLGVDLGVNNIAVCSDNSFYNSRHHKKVKGEYQFLKRRLQSVGTRSAKRKLTKIANRERRFVKDLNHRLSKELVSKPFGIFALEDLNGIKRKQKKGKVFNRMLGNWSYRQLQTFVEYKAEREGKSVLFVKPAYTSQTCSHCGYKHKSNRKGRQFKCKSCGFMLDADLNASRNIATFSRSICGRLSVNQPIVASNEVKGRNAVATEDSYKLPPKNSILGGE